MRRTLSAAVAFAAISCFTPAQSAPISIVNGNFEAAPSSGLIAIPGVGDVWLGADGYGYTGVAAQFAPVAGIYANVPPGDTVGVVNAGSTLFQLIGVPIEAGASYSVSGLVGNRADYAPFGGSVGFYVGSSDNIIASSVFAAPTTNGVLQAFTAAFDQSFFSNYVGQIFGFFIAANSGQVTVDNLAVDVTRPAIQLASVTQPLETPLPGAAFLFLAGVAGGATSIRKRQSTFVK